MLAVKSYAIVKSTNSSQTSLVTKQDKVVVEEPLQIWVKHTSPNSPAELLFTTMRTPGDDIQLVKGWLLSSAVLQSASEIISIAHTGSGILKQQTTNQILITLSKKVDWQAYQRIETVNSACGVCGQQSIEQLSDKLSTRRALQAQHWQLNNLTLYQLTQSLKQQQKLFADTGGIHAAGLFNQQLKIVDVREDVGRHNALDKLIGGNFVGAEQLNSLGYGLILSGRISFELVQKAAMANIQLIVAIGAPSSLAIDLAKECDMILLGFVKSSGFNCYAGFDKFTVDQS